MLFRSTLERQREGIAIARAHNKYKHIEIPAEIWQREYTRYTNQEITKAGLAKALGISRPTLYKIIAEKESLAF